MEEGVQRGGYLRRDLLGNRTYRQRVEMEREEIVQQLEVFLENLKLLVSDQNKLRRGLYKEVSEEIREKREATALLQTNLNEEIFKLEQQAHERNSAAYTQIDVLSAQEAECRSEIARVAKLLTPEDGANGLKIEQEGGWKISVSKIKSSISYKTDDLLHALPHFASARIDGDPLVERAINPAVLERLVASGDVEEEEIRPFQVVTAERKPTVRITIGEDDE
jgi:hypothetical protein